MNPAYPAIWISLLLLSGVSAGRMELLANQAAQARPPTAASPVPVKTSLFVDISADYGAQLTLTDLQGRITGYDPAMAQTLNGIPDSSYGDDSISDATDDSVDAASAESRVLEIHPIPPSQYSLKVSPTDRDSYNIQFFCSAGKDASANLSASRVGIVRGEVHSFLLAVAADCSGKFVSGAFGEQNRTALLTYAYPIADHVHLTGGSSFRLVIVYDRRVDPSSFSATLNGNTIVNLFHPRPNTIESVTIPIQAGHNLVQLSIAGISGRESSKTQTDSFVVDSH